MGKRINGEGTIYKRSDGRWCGAYYIGSKRKFVYGKTQKEVISKLKDVKAEAEEVSHLFETTYNLETWIKMYIDEYKTNELKPSTLSTYLTFYRKHLKDSDIGKIRLSELSTDDLQKYYNDKLRSGLSAKTVRHIAVIVRESLKQALRLKYIKYNPHDAVVLPKKEIFKGDTLSVEEVKHLMNDAKGEELYPLVMTAIFTGMRRGELLGLQWENVDFDAGIIHVEQSLCRIDDGFDENGKHHTKRVLMEPKTQMSKRVIPITQPLMHILKEHKKSQDNYKSQISDIYNLELDLVFANNIGEFMQDRSLLRDFYTMLDKYNITRVRFHDLRHTFASMLLESGTEGKLVQELLGHASISTTMDIYAHITTGQKMKTVEKLSEILK